MSRFHQCIRSALLRVSGPPLWTPANITTLLWLDSAAASTFSLDGTAVNQWNDRSGNLRHVSQATAGKRPTKTASGVQLSKTAQTQLINSAWTPAYPWQMHAVVVVPANTAGILFKAGRWVGTDAQMNGSSVGLGSNSQDTPARNLVGGKEGVVWHIHTTTTIDHDVISYRANASASDAAWINGASVTLSGTNVARAMSVSDGITIGGASVGTAPAHRYPDATIQELIVTDPLTATDLEKLHGYLAHKWGREGDLPLAHPYKSAPPRL